MLFHLIMGHSRLDPGLCPFGCRGPLSGSVRLVCPEKRLVTRCGPAGAGDFNKDAQSDILWESSVTGQAIVWHMKDPPHSRKDFLQNLTTPWNILDFDGFHRDRSPDISWMTPETGKIAAPCMRNLVHLDLEVLAVRAPPIHRFCSCLPALRKFFNFASEISNGGGNGTQESSCGKRTIRGV